MTLPVRRRSVEKRYTMVPGPRTIVKLDVSEVSLPILLAGMPAERCWLTDEGDGVYSFHATKRLGESRKEPGTPAIDLLVEVVNEFANGLDAEDVPQRLRDQWDALVDRYVSQTADRT